MLVSVLQNTTNSPRLLKSHLVYIKHSSPSRNLHCVSNMTGKYYVSVTGLIPKSFLLTLKFFYYTLSAYQAATEAPGNILCSKFTHEKIHMTITVWESKEAMQSYFRGPAHVEAMKQTKDVGSYVKIHGYFTDELPQKSDAIAAWKKDGRRVHGEPRKNYGDILKSS